MRISQGSCFPFPSFLCMPPTNPRKNTPSLFFFFFLSLLSLSLACPCAHSPSPPIPMPNCVCTCVSDNGGAWEIFFLRFNEEEARAISSPCPCGLLSCRKNSPFAENRRADAYPTFFFFKPNRNTRHLVLWCPLSSLEIIYAQAFLACADYGKCGGRFFRNKRVLQTVFMCAAFSIDSELYFTLPLLRHYARNA